MGVPKVLKTDNGLPFNGHTFFEFAEFFNYGHCKITPLHPAAKGLLEKFMRNLSKVLINSKTLSTGVKSYMLFCAVTEVHRTLLLEYLRPSFYLVSTECIDYRQFSRCNLFIFRIFSTF